MYSYYRFFSISIFICFIFFSCEKEIILKSKITHPRLCLNCILEAGKDSIEISITKTQGIEVSDNFVPIANLQIELKKEEQILDGIVYRGNGIYKIKHTAESGKKYKIKINVEGYEPLFAETTVPFVPVIQAKLKQDTIIDENWINGYRTKLRIIVDLSDTSFKDFYWFQKGEIKKFGASFSSSYYTDKMYFDEFNRYFNQDNSYPFTNYEYIGGLRLDDELFNNSKIQFSISGWPKETLFVINADPHFDKYYKSSIKQFLTYEYDQMPIFEPVQIYSNVKNGFGIFGSIAVSKHYLNNKL